MLTCIALGDDGFPCQDYVDFYDFRQSGGFEPRSTADGFKVKKGGDAGEEGRRMSSKVIVGVVK